MMGRYSPLDTLNLAGAGSADRNTVHGGGNVTRNVNTIRHRMNLNHDVRR